ncbi:MAG: TrmH family RNA methyltransferase [bacterium]
MLPKSIRSRINALKLNMGRTSDRYFLAEGLRIVQEGISSGWQPDFLVIEEDYLDRCKEVITILESKVQVYTVTKKEMRELSGLDTPSGVLGIFPRREIAFQWEDFIVVTDGIQDPGNLGTIIRIADAVGVGEVVTLKGTVDPYSYKVVRASMGSIFHVPVIRERNPKDFFLRLKGYYQIVGTSSHSGVVYSQFYWRFPLALVLGNEGKGISKDVEIFCDDMVNIPILGKAESLNVAIAFGVIAYQVVMNKKI